MIFERSLVIEAPAADLFRMSQDYAHRLDWDPFLRSADLIGTDRAEVGARAVCVSRGGWSMETEYVSFNPPRASAVKMTRGPWFLKDFAGSWRFAELGDGRTRVGFRYNLHARPGWLSWLLSPIVSRAFARETARRLKALKVASETATCPEAVTRRR